MTFFRTTIYLCIGLIIFSLAVSFVSGLDVFPSEIEGGSTSETDPQVDYSFTLIFSFSLATGVTLIICIIMRSVVPLGLYIFSVVYWVSWINAQSILSIGGYIPTEFLALATIGVGFLFVAAMIGILTGSG